MPDRIVRASILDSKAFNELSDEAEVLYRRLLSVVDDFGCYEADPELIQAKCFWRKSELWPADRIARALADICARTNADGSVLMRTYTSAGKTLLRIYKLGKPRAKRLKYPLPDGDACGHLQADACACWQTQADADICKQTQTKETNVLCTNTTTTTDTNSKNEDAKWAEFKAVYPQHRLDEEKACRAWIAREQEADAIIAGLRLWVASEDWTADAGKWVKWASGFISNGIYKTKPQVPGANIPAPPKPWKADW